MQKKVLIFSDKNTFHAVQCITMRAPKPPPTVWSDQPDEADQTLQGDQSDQIDWGDHYDEKI